MAQKLIVNDLTLEFAHNPLGLDSRHPRFSWKISGSERGTLQRSYEIRVGSAPAKAGSMGNLIWETGKINRDSSTLVPYSGPALVSAGSYSWQVRTGDNHGNESAWSAVQTWKMGILEPSGWTAKWISTFPGDTLQGACPFFRKSFSTAKKVRTATAFITAHGMYEALLNGKKIGLDYFTPGWTSYHKHLLYQTYDVTEMVRSGENTLGLILGDGWYKGTLGFEGKHGYYGKQLSGMLQLQIEYTDGSTQAIQTDGTWKYSYGPILYSDLYNGESFDARKKLNGWASSGYTDTNWKNACLIAAGPEPLVASISPLARKHEEFKPIRILRTPKGETVLDFGQNLVGWVRFKVSGNRGTTVRVEHGEVLDKQGNFYKANLRTARQLISYTLEGGGMKETYEPHFTYQGFRYIKLEGYPGTPLADDFRAIALYSDMKPTGSFETSNTMLNQLQHNIQWGQKGNFVDVPTDCPQRDERLGWTGDAQVFSRTAAFNMDVAGFFTKWLKDVAADQLPGGSVPYVIPNVLGDQASGSAGWADVATVIPWNMYLAYGDRQLLEVQYASMKGWVDFMSAKSTNHLWNTGNHFGDWLFYHPEDDNDGRAAITDKYLIAQTFYAHSTQLLINAAKVLKKESEVHLYETLLAKIKTAFLAEYLTPNGRLVSGSQTAYVLALNFDMLPENLRQQAAERLVANIHDYGNHLTTGFLGTPYLCHVLSRFGHTDVAYALLLQDTYPSWLYPVKMGATTIWERWDGQKPDGSFQTTNMNSFNHYAYGAIGDWMYREIAGLDTEESGPGYKKISIKPRLGGGLTFVKARLETLYGTASSAWKVHGNLYTFDMVVPANTTATIILPGAGKARVMESGAELVKAAGVSGSHAEGADLQLYAGSGTYHFEFTL